MHQNTNESKLWSKYKLVRWGLHGTFERILSELFVFCSKKIVRYKFEPCPQWPLSPSRTVRSLFRLRQKAVHRETMYETLCLCLCIITYDIIWPALHDLEERQAMTSGSFQWLKSSSFNDQKCRYNLFGLKEMQASLSLVVSLEQQCWNIFWEPFNFKNTRNSLPNEHKQTPLTMHSKKLNMRVILWDSSIVVVKPKFSVQPRSALSQRRGLICQAGNRSWGTWCNRESGETKSPDHLLNWALHIIP